MTIGRKPSKRVAIPDNRGMNQRANAHLENIAIAKAEHYENSLPVDAPLFYFWYKSTGSIPCTCSAADHTTNPEFEPGTRGNTNLSNFGSEITNTIDEGSLPKENSMDDFFGLKKEESVRKSKVPLDKQLIEDADDDSYTDVEDLDDDVSTLRDVDDPLNIFTDKAINCPVCMGAGYIDAWNLHGGLRAVFTSYYPHFKADRVDIDTTKNPDMMTASNGGKVYWTMTLPFIWLKILKIGVFRGTDEVKPNVYKWQWVDADNGSNIGEVTSASLETLNNTGKQIRLILTFLEDEVEFTHAEIVFAFREPYRAQMPEVTQGYEQEFLDWQVSMTVELPPSIQIKEGNYLTESKYAKVWKVNTLTHRVTNGGTVFGITAELRALHSFEQKFMQLALFRTSKKASGRFVQPYKKYIFNPVWDDAK